MNGSMKTGLRMALLMLCIASTSVWSDDLARPGITA